MKQKTVRFYEDVPEDARAFEKLNNYRKYGFRSSQEMIIEAINEYGSGNQKDSLGMNGKDIENLADQLIAKLKENEFVITKGDAQEGEKNDEDHSENNTDDMFQKALSFMESL